MNTTDSWKLRADAVGDTALVVGPSAPRARVKRLPSLSGAVAAWLDQRIIAQPRRNTATRSVILGGELHGARMLRRIAVTLEQDHDGWFVASDREFNVYGHGRTEKAAIADYRKALREFCELVVASTRAEDGKLKAQVRRWVSLKN